MRIIHSAALVLLAVPLWAQNYEFGLHGGLSVYLSKTVKNANASADAGFKMGYAGGVAIGHDMYEHLGGELRYTYLRNNLRVASGGTEVSFGGESHALEYDLLLHTKPRGSKVRPYVVFGGGLKYFRGTGEETPFLPLQSFAIPTRTSEAEPLISAGAGIKFALGERTSFRLDVRDYLSPFPQEVLAPAPGAELGGWTHNIVPTVGIAFTF